MSDVDGVLDAALDDPHVAVRLYRGWSLTPRGRCERLYQPGARFAVEASPRLARVGRIVRGRLRVDPAADLTGAVHLPAVVDGTDVGPDVRRLGLAVAFRGACGVDGNLGGVVLRAGFERPLCARGPKLCGLARLLSDELVDLPTSGTCAAPVGAFGVGFHTRMVRATIDPTPVAGPVSGMCGTP